MVVEDMLHGKMGIISFSVWNVSYVNKRTRGDGYKVRIVSLASPTTAALS